MKKGLLRSLTGWVAGAGLALSQAGGLAAADLPGDEAAAADPEPWFPCPPAAGLPDHDVPDEPHEPQDVPPTCVWASAEFLFWRAKNSPVSQPLVFTAPADTVLGGPGSRVLFGGSDIDFDRFPGGRATVGFWLDPDRILGLEASGFFLAKQSFDFRVGSNGLGVPFLARPFIDVLANTENRTLIADPGNFAGQFIVSSSSRFFGYDVSAVDDVGKVWGFYTQLLAGFRYFQLDEDLRLTQTSTFISPLAGQLFVGQPVSQPATEVLFDSFNAKTQFYGGQIGMRNEARWGPFFVNATTKLALGVSRESLIVFGSSSLIVPNTPTFTVPGGLLALPSNNGRHTKNQFAVSPQAGVSVGYFVTPNLRMTLGYDIVYLSDVLRPGEQIDRRVNATQVPTSNRFGQSLGGEAVPQVPMLSSSYYAHGISIGLGFQY